MFLCTYIHITVDCLANKRKKQDDDDDDVNWNSFLFLFLIFSMSGMLVLDEK
jgi:hypothetical protein